MEKEISPATGKAPAFPGFVAHPAGYSDDVPPPFLASMIMDHFRVENLSISFGGLKAVHEVSFRVEENFIFSIIGPNGSGKTTIFNLISGIYRPDSGSVLLEGENLTGSPRTASPAGASPGRSRTSNYSRMRACWTTCSWPAYPHEDGGLFGGLPGGRRSRAAREEIRKGSS